VSTLDKHLEETERYGFDRACFPVEYNGHEIYILSNDAKMVDGRIIYDLSLHCISCRVNSTIAGRFPAEYDDQPKLMVGAKIGVFKRFKYNECV